jgi:ATP-dependent Clp protease ATP-binding subunit ClpC
MFERFTDRGRRVVVLAQEESRLLDHDYIGTEHLLLALSHEGEGVAARVLKDSGVELTALRAEVERRVPRGDGQPAGHIPFTPRAKKVLELSLREALSLGHNYIGTEHLLLGLLREEEGVAAQVLTGMGLELEAVRRRVVETLDTVGGTRAGSPVEAVEPPTCPGCHRSLAGDGLAIKLIEVPEAGAVRIVYCRRCGRALGPIP